LHAVEAAAADDTLGAALGPAGVGDAARFFVGAVPVGGPFPDVASQIEDAGARGAIGEAAHRGGGRVAVVALVHLAVDVELARPEPGDAFVAAGVEALRAGGLVAPGIDALAGAPRCIFPLGL